MVTDLRYNYDIRQLHLEDNPTYDEIFLVISTYSNIC